MYLLLPRDLTKTEKMIPYPNGPYSSFLICFWWTFLWFSFRVVFGRGFLVSFLVSLVCVSFSCFSLLSLISVSLLARDRTKKRENNIGSACVNTKHPAYVDTRSSWADRRFASLAHCLVGSLSSRPSSFF